MDDLQIFKNEEFGEVRTVVIDGTVWFVAKDVSDSLGYSETNTMTKRLDGDDFISTKLEGMNMNSTLINESGLYASVLGSKLVSAKRFKKWVTSEVLPSIRQNGGYITNQENLTDTEILAKAVLLANNVIAQKDRLIQEMKPKVEFFDQVADSKNALPMDRVAKVLNIGIGRNRLFEILREKKVLDKNNIPYQTYVDRGYFRVIEQKFTKPSGETQINIKTLVYQRGVDYIRKQLAN